MPPKEHYYDFKIVICKDENGNTFDLATATPVFEGELDCDVQPTEMKLNETITITIKGRVLRKAIKRALGIRNAEVLFPKKHRHKASVARKRRRNHGRTENVCQDNNRQ